MPKKFVVLVTVAGSGGVITVRYHPDPAYLKREVDKIEPGKGVGDVWPRDIRDFQLKNTQQLVTVEMVGRYEEITTATGELEWDVEVTSARLHKGSYKHLNLEPDLEALIWPE